MKLKFSARNLTIIELFFILWICTLYLIPTSALGNTTLLGVLLAYSCYVALLDIELRPLVYRIILLVGVLALMFVLLTDPTSIAQDVSNRGLKRFFSNLYHYYSLFFPVILFFRVYRAGSQTQKKIITLLALVMIGYIMLNTRAYLVNNPNATRSWEGFEETSKLNIANYQHIIAFPAIVAIAVASLSQLRAMNKVLCIVAIVVAMEFLLAAQYTLSILIATIGIFYQIGQTIRRRANRVIYTTLMIVVMPFIPIILEYAIQTIPSEQVTLRLREILNFISGHGADGYNLNGRLILYGKSVLAFLTSPIWGNRRLDFNGHATFLTILADTGILGGIPFYYLLNMTIKKLNSILGKYKKPYITVILILVLTGLTNPIHASMPLGFVTWFIAPTVIIMIFGKESEYNEKALGN